jgi:hypothetical protein
MKHWHTNSISSCIKQERNLQNYFHVIFGKNPEVLILSGSVLNFLPEKENICEHGLSTEAMKF